MGSSGYSQDDDRRYALYILNAVLGGSMSSRLFQEIREQRGLAYAVYSFISSFVDAGMFGIYAGVSADNTEETIALILKELGKIKERPVETSELQKAKEYTKGSLLLALESNDNQMVRLAQNEIHFDRYTPMAEVLEKIDKVTPEEILELSADLFQSDHLAMTILGPVKDRKALENILVL